MKMNIVRLTKNSSLALETDLLNGRTGFIEYSYEEVERLLNPPPKKRKRYTSTGKIGKVLSLYLRALNTGHWSTGRSISPRVVHKRIVTYLSGIPNQFLQTLTGPAKDALFKILNHEMLLSEERNILRGIINE